MQLVIKANNIQKEELLEKGFPTTVEVFWNTTVATADAYFDLLFEEEADSFIHIKDKPVFVNAVITTTQYMPANYIRINGWNGFLKDDGIEIVANATNLPQAKEILDTLNWKYQLAPDEPGMVAPRIIAMIINEAYFAFQEKVSTKEEIDIAMTLGTNYPHGPFEWSEKIGLHKIYLLLKTLSATNKRYTPSPKLEEALKSIA